MYHGAGRLAQCPPHARRNPPDGVYRLWHEPKLRLRLRVRVRLRLRLRLTVRLRVRLRLRLRLRLYLAGLASWQGWLVGWAG